MFQCFGSALVSMRIRIQHFRSMRIRFRIHIQGFYDENFQLKKRYFLIKNCNAFIPRPPQRRPSLKLRENFFICLDVLHGGLKTGKLQFFPVFGINPWISIGIQPKMLDPDQNEYGFETLVIKQVQKPGLKRGFTPV
jgi:hypothetical protein